jgi:RNA polymerase-binding transcription factor DksA
MPLSPARLSGKLFPRRKTATWKRLCGKYILLPLMSSTLLRAGILVIEVVGIRRTCGLCNKHFYICLACDRWHWYCGPDCSQGARKRSLRKSRRKYSQSKKGRRANSLAQKNHRKRRRLKKIVSHQSSASALPALPPKHAEAAQELVLGPSVKQVPKEEVNESTRQKVSNDRFLQCLVCGCAITQVPLFDKFRHSRKEKELTYDNHTRDTC